jgi:hypothetical protein
MAETKPKLVWRRGVWVCTRQGTIIRGTGLTPVIAYNDFVRRHGLVVARMYIRGDEKYLKTLS